MASSDDEGELALQSVTGYFFEDANDDPISFSVLPYSFDSKKKQDSSKQQVFLLGTGDSGCMKVYKEVTEWRLGLEDAHPEIMVRAKGGKWIKLLKPRKSYESVIRTILITTQLLHYLRRNPESSEKSALEHMRRVFSTFDDTPTANDVVDHYPLIKMLVERDDVLAKSQLLRMLLKEKPRKKCFGEALQDDSDSKKTFIVDDDLEDGMGNNDRDESEEEPDLFDSVCAICDNGGELLCCEGKCMRCFHATEEDGEDSDCKSLGFSRAQFKAIQNQNFLCGNCKYKKHQCFVCGKLGSSDKSAGAEVFACVNATCGYFYHPKCVAGLLFPENKTEAVECEKKVAGGESFACPVHKCHICKQGENKEDVELQFAVCRRCPRSYHRKCLPRKIAFEDIEEEGIIQRAWEDLLPNRILIYCLMVAFLKSASSSLTLADIERKLMMPSTHSQTVRNVDKSITLGKVEGSVEAVKTALKKLEDGGNVEDAKAVCEPDILKQIMRWNMKLKVYLAPFLHGMRYTSFGRHFTKVDKLKEIVEKLQWYVQNGDTIVDFCCGANDFSRLMKEKLDAAGKKCSYKNYDVIQPKYEFNFEKRDWMTVQPEELPTGSQLIMGLNPPFGVKASLANKFIDKALTFKPKLVILIVPSETERLDKKRSSYDLIWEDCEKLSGKSFYLPGSVDVNDMQIEQWNNKPPPLYLWSRPDWTAKHRTIAMKQGHIFGGKHELPAEEEKFRVARSPESLENKEAMTLDTNPKKENDKTDTEIKRIPKEENNKTETESKKISPPDDRSRSSKRKSAKRKAQREVKRTKLEAEDGKKETELSDSSISPRKISDRSESRVPIETVEPPRESFPTFAQRTNSAGADMDINDSARRYATPSISGAHNWSNDMTSDHRDYTRRNSEERVSGYDGRLGSGRSLDVDTRIPQARFSSGISDSALGRTDMFSSSSYGLSNSILGSSVMQRYASRLDEMNFPRGTGNLGRNNGLDLHGMRGNLPPDAYGFAPGPQRQFQHNNSKGWLDD